MKYLRKIIQSNAELLSDIYSDESMSSDLLTETSGAVSLIHQAPFQRQSETEETADQTDIQVMILDRKYVRWYGRAEQRF